MQSPPLVWTQPIRFFLDLTFRNSDGSPYSVRIDPNSSTLKVVAGKTTMIHDRDLILAALAIDRPGTIEGLEMVTLNVQTPSNLATIQRDQLWGIVDQGLTQPMDMIFRQAVSYITDHRQRVSFDLWDLNPTLEIRLSRRVLASSTIDSRYPVDRTTRESLGLPKMIQ